MAMAVGDPLSAAWPRKASFTWVKRARPSLAKSTRPPRVTSTRSRSPSLSVSAKSDWDVLSSTASPAASVTSAKVPSPWLRKRRLGRPEGCET